MMMRDFLQYCESVGRRGGEMIAPDGVSQAKWEAMADRWEALYGERPEDLAKAAAAAEAVRS